MAVDTLAKRASVLHMVIPDGTIAQRDRQTITRLYGGILSNGFIPPEFVELTNKVFHSIFSGTFVTVFEEV